LEKLLNNYELNEKTEQKDLEMLFDNLSNIRGYDETH
jgi:hypothetical protein